MHISDWKTLATIDKPDLNFIFSQKTLNSSSEFFSENLQRIRALVHWSIIYKHFWSICKHYFTTVEQEITTVPLNISHGSGTFEHDWARVSFQYSSIHLLEYQGTAVSTNHGQRTPESTLFFKLGKISNLAIIKIMLCLLKILPCWLYWALNREKWLSIERETLN